MPLRTIAIAVAPYAAATLSSNLSTDANQLPNVSGRVAVTKPACPSCAESFGRTTYAIPPAATAPEHTQAAGNPVAHSRTSGKRLCVLRDKCCAITIGIGKVLGRPASTAVSASIPPAEETMTTTPALLEQSS